MIHSASPQSPVGSDCRLILKFWDGRTDGHCEYSDHCGLPRGSIKLLQIKLLSHSRSDNSFVLDDSDDGSQVDFEEIIKKSKNKAAPKTTPKATKKKRGYNLKFSDSEDEEDKENVQPARSRKVTKKVKGIKL